MITSFFLLLFCLRVFPCSPSSEIASTDCDSSLNSYASRGSPIKSILKAPNSPSTRMFQNISFAPDTKGCSFCPVIEADKIEDINDAIKYVYATSEIDKIAIDHIYDIPEGRFVVDYGLPQEFQ